MCSGVAGKVSEEGSPQPRDPEHHLLRYPLFFTLFGPTLSRTQGRWCVEKIMKDGVGETCLVTTRRNSSTNPNGQCEECVILIGGDVDARILCWPSLPQMMPSRGIKAHGAAAPFLQVHLNLVLRLAPFPGFCLSLNLMSIVAICTRNKCTGDIVIIFSSLFHARSYSGLSSSTKSCQAA